MSRSNFSEIWVVDRKIWSKSFFYRNKNYEMYKHKNNSPILKNKNGKIYERYTLHQRFAQSYFPK